MTGQDVAAAKRVITSLIHQHMPSAAVASGWASAVDPAAWVRRVSDLIPAADRPEDLGMTALAAWLKTQGFEAGPHYLKALRHEWMMTRMAAEWHRQGGVGRATR